MTKALVVVQEKRCLIARPQRRTRLAVRPLARVLTTPGKRLLVRQTAARVLVTGRQGPRGRDNVKEVHIRPDDPMVNYDALWFEPVTLQNQQGDPVDGCWMNLIEGGV